MQGMGLFTAGFLSGYLLVLLLTALSRSLWLRLYGPFLPFALGAWAVVPYAVQSAGLLSAVELHQPVWRLFVFYPLLSAVEGPRPWLLQVEAYVALTTVAYLHLLWRYVRLVQRAPHHAE